MSYLQVFSNGPAKIKREREDIQGDKNVNL